MRTSFLVIVPLLLAGTIAGLASPPTETPPSKPFVANAPANSQWTVTYKPKSREKKAATAEDIRTRKLRQRYSPLVLSRHTIKAPGKMVTYITYEAGLKSEAWMVGGYIYELPLREDQSLHISTKSHEDFPEISWISAENFRGTVELNKRKVHQYETDAPETPPDPASPEQPDQAKASARNKPTVRRAYIDAETRLPVKVETQTTVMTYQFDEPPPTFPELDERVAQQIKQSNG